MNTLIALSVAAALSSSTPSPEDLDVAAGGAPFDGGRKVAAVELTPLGLFVGHYGAQLEVVPAPHHGIVLSGFYLAQSSTVPAGDGSAAVRRTFQGFGGELGYRYFFGRLGPHGLYLGPSLLGGNYHGAGYTFHDLGGALDVGYQAILGSVLIGLSAGAQYLYADNHVPEQGDLGVDVHTQSALRPRVGVTLGWAF